jgi:hypothetical protein
MKIVSRKSYEELRRSEYPPIEDQLDALWKGGKEASDMKDIILATKLKYPKNNEPRYNP